MANTVAVNSDMPYHHLKTFDAENLWVYICKLLIELSSYMYKCCVTSWCFSRKREQSMAVGGTGKGTLDFGVSEALFCKAPERYIYELQWI